MNTRGSVSNGSIWFMSALLCSIFGFGVTKVVDTHIFLEIVLGCAVWIASTEGIAYIFRNH